MRGNVVTFTLTDRPPRRARSRCCRSSTRALACRASSWFQQVGDGQIEIRLTDERGEEMQRAAVTQSLEIVRRRIDEVGTREPTIQRQGDDRILVQVPGEKDPESIKRLLGQTAKLTFHLVDLDTSVEQALSGNPPPPELLPAATTMRPAGGAVRGAQARRGQRRKPGRRPADLHESAVVSFRFDLGGRAQIRQRHPRSRRRAAGDRAQIDEPILGGSGIIRGSFTVQEANELAVLLRAGALPAPLNIVEERSVGPDLGADSIEAGAMAAVLAFILVAAFMVIYYGLFGLIADLALVVNLLPDVRRALGLALTLPGIAGIVLTIGQAIDSNVLIYERIREETRLGRTPIAAVDTGFREALRTIVDANLTALIAAVLLYAFGSGPVRGFAVTLGMGIVTTMFTRSLHQARHGGLAVADAPRRSPGVRPDKRCAPSAWFPTAPTSGSCITSTGVTRSRAR